MNFDMLKDVDQAKARYQALRASVDLKVCHQVWKQPNVKLRPNWNSFSRQLEAVSGLCGLCRVNATEGYKRFFATPM